MAWGVLEGVAVGPPLGVRPEVVVMAFGEGMDGVDTSDRKKMLRSLAWMVVRQLKRQGCTRREMVSFANELLSFMTDELKTEPGPSRSVDKS
jgi:hypothetical protein